MQIIVPLMDDGSIGLGVDLFTADKRNTPFDSTTIPEIKDEEVTGQNTVFYAELVESASRANSLLEISAQASAGIGAFSGKVSAGYSQMTSTNSYSLFIVGFIDITFQRQGYSSAEISKLKFSPEVIDWFKGPNDYPRFRKKYGDAFIMGAQRGGRLCLIVEIATNSEEDKKAAAASVKLSGVSWSAQASFKSLLDTLTKSRKITVRILQQGGNWNFTSTDADGLWESIFHFPADVKANPVYKSYELMPYGGVKNWPSAIDNSLSFEDIERVLSDYDKTRTEYTSLLNNAKYIKNNIIAFSDISEDKNNTEEIDTLIKYIKDSVEILDSEFKKLIKNPIDNMDIKPATDLTAIDDLSGRLPEWRTNLPSSAKDILLRFPKAPSDEYDIWLHGDGTKPVKMYCNMETQKEYLTLKYRNTSMVRGNAYRSDNGEDRTYPGPDCVTKWTRIRLDVETLEVDLEDFSFAESEGENSKFSKVKFGAAHQCAGENHPSAEAVIDIRGTPFIFNKEVEFKGHIAYNDKGDADPKQTQVACYRAKGFCSEWGPVYKGVNRLVLTYKRLTDDYLIAE